MGRGSHWNQRKCRADQVQNHHHENQHRDKPQTPRLSEIMILFHGVIPPADGTAANLAPERNPLVVAIIAECVDVGCGISHKMKDLLDSQDVEILPQNQRLKEDFVEES